MKTRITFLSLVGMIALGLTQKADAQVNDVQMYGFIHSLVVHQPKGVIAVNSETATPYWVNEIAKSNNHSYSFTGQFGQLPDHLNSLPPTSNIGFPGVDSPWDGDRGETFSTSTTNTILVTPANFIYWVPPTETDPSDPERRSVVRKTEMLFDWCHEAKSGLRFYIYGNWPEMDNAKDFPPNLPTQNEINKFHNITMGSEGTFHNWWLQYQDALMQSRPDLEIRLIPIGEIMSKIHTQVIPNQIPFDELFEDSDPHGRANTYFLAGLITYMAVYEQKVPENYMPSTIIHPAIRNNLSEINKFIWQELNNFNFPSGESRVFYSKTLGMADSNREKHMVSITNPNEDLMTIQLGSDQNQDIFVYDLSGRLVLSASDVKGLTTLNIESLSPGKYIVRIEGNGVYYKKIVKN